MAGAESPDFSAIIMLCDSVACPEGKLYIQGGGWQTLQSDRYPVRIPRIGVAVIVTVPYARTNERHELSLSFRNGEGRDLPAAKPGSPPGEPVHASQSFFNIDRPLYLRPGDSQLLTSAANFDGLIVPEPDTYHFAVLIDGREISRASFRLVR
jgi:hypothetical protein